MEVEKNKKWFNDIVRNKRNGRMTTDTRFWFCMDYHYRLRLDEAEMKDGIG